jgi:uncharacterized protein (DUF2344 family)
LRYLGSCRNDGTLLQPEHIIIMLEQVAGQEFHLLKVHREKMILGEGGGEVISNKVISTKESAN